MWFYPPELETSVSDEEIEDKMEDKENKLKSLTPSNNGNEVFNTRIAEVGVAFQHCNSYPTL